MPFVELARELSGQVPDFLKREGAVPAAFVPRLARQVLSGDYGVPEAFCRLGTSLTHILVDDSRIPAANSGKPSIPLFWKPFLAAVRSHGGRRQTGHLRLARRRRHAL